jgi:hypothetical protein
MTDIKYNKLVNPADLRPAESVPSEAQWERTTDQGTTSSADGVKTAFINDIDDNEFRSSVYLGSGPHIKARNAVKITDPIPSRTSKSNPEDFFDQTFIGTYDPTLPSPGVKLQTGTSQFKTPPSLLQQTGLTIIYEVNGGTAVTVSTLTGLRSITLAGFSTAGEYRVRVRLRGTTTAGISHALYLTGLALENDVWAGVPTIEPSGALSYDMTVQMPDVPGVGDWEMEMTEL